MSFPYYIPGIPEGTKFPVCTICGCTEIVHADESEMKFWVCYDCYIKICCIQRR